MGFVQNKATIVVNMSNHNSVNDDLDYVRWAWMLKDIADVVARYYGRGESLLVGPSIGPHDLKWEIEESEDHRGHFYLDELNRSRVGDHLKGLMD